MNAENLAKWVDILCNRFPNIFTELSDERRSLAVQTIIDVINGDLSLANLQIETNEGRSVALHKVLSELEKWEGKFSVINRAVEVMSDIHQKIQAKSEEYHSQSSEQLRVKANDGYLDRTTIKLASPSGTGEQESEVQSEVAANHETMPRVIEGFNRSPGDNGTENTAISSPTTPTFPLLSSEIGDSVPGRNTPGTPRTPDSSVPIKNEDVPTAQSSESPTHHKEFETTRLPNTNAVQTESESKDQDSIRKLSEQGLSKENSFDYHVSHQNEQEQWYQESVLRQPLRLKNGTVQESYSWEWEGEVTGEIQCAGSVAAGLYFDARTRTLTGTPMRDGEFWLFFKVVGAEQNTKAKYESKLVINPQPQSIWKEKDPPKNSRFCKPHSDHASICANDFFMIAASKRGRSHAHNALFRDDAYEIAFVEKTGWSILAVADGAGYAKLSREGADLACKTSVSYLQEKLADTTGPFHNLGSLENRKSTRNNLYNLLPSAALHAKKQIQERARNEKESISEFATTFLVVIHKAVEDGHFVAGFWIGDGGLAIYKNGASQLLGQPDSGEYGGQTRFLISPEVFQSGEAINRRIHFKLIEDFTALLVMSDGITDPKFETDRNLMDPDFWDKLWEELVKECNLRQSEGADERLLKWLDFWSPGNHDDRTIAVLYAPEKLNESIEVTRE